jgi:Domain of unknown function (DUF929)
VSKGKRLAQERARQIVAAQRRADARRRRLAIAGGVVAAVVLVVAVLVGVKLATKKGTPAAAPSASPAAASVVSAVTGVPANVLDQVGVGKVDTLPKTTSGQTVQTDSGKPLILYIGAEYCPYCAAERWAMVVALSRFGTFSNLGQTHSSSTDTYPNTATLSFHGATYTSQYLTFQGVETETNQPNSSGGYTTLDTPTATQEQLLKKYNAAPYVSSDVAGSIPFIDFANQAVVSGASYSPQLLAGKTADQIAAALSNPSDPIAQAVNGTANAFTALICKLTNNQPAAVCGSAAVTAYQGKL